MDKPNSRWGPRNACPLQQDLKSQSASLTGCKTPWKLLLSSYSAAARVAEPPLTPHFQPSHVQDEDSSRRSPL